MHSPISMAAIAAAVASALFSSTVYALPEPGFFGHETTTMSSYVPYATPTPTPTTTSFEAIPWVHVDRFGSQTTITPRMTTIEGTKTKTVSPPPWALTMVKELTVPFHHSTVVTTHTGRLPKPTGKNGAGAFLECKNNATDSETAPWCAPYEGSRLFTHWRYYFVWDERWFNESQRDNGTLRVEGRFLNQTTGEKLDWAMGSDPLPISQGYWYRWIEPKHWLAGDRDLEQGTAIALQLNLYPNLTYADAGGNATATVSGPTIIVTKEPHYVTKGPQMPNNTELYVALPLIFGSIFIFMAAVCIYNRKVRRINLGNVMSRSRFNLKPSRRRNHRRKGGNTYERVQANEDGEFLEIGGGGPAVRAGADDSDDEFSGVQMSSLNSSGRPFEASSFREELSRQTKKD